MKNREIKFRLWCFETNSFYTDGFSVDMDGWSWHDDNDKSHRLGTNYSLQQYTGLKDKNGVEIYEGDVVRIFNWNWCGEQQLIGTSTIVFDTDNGCWQTEDLIVEDQNDFYRKANFEVIGNIYQNTDLL